MKTAKLFKKLAAATIALSLIAQSIPVFGSGSLPWTGDRAHGENEPTVRAYTAQQLIDWTPEEYPYAELLRSRIPLQERIDAYSDTQANPMLSEEVQMLTVMGDYGDSFMDNPAYTNVFSVYTFNFWQYTDYISYWHGSATAYEDRELYDPTDDWRNRWFEIGFLNIPNPAWSDAAHKNGVLSLGQVFFSDNDRGMLTYKQMIVKDEDGTFPVAEKMIEIAEYYGFDGYFFNQEETGAYNGDAWHGNVHPDDFADYRAFMSRIKEAGLYINWYDAVSSSGGNSFARTINDGNVDWLYNRATGEEVSDSFFFDYTSSYPSGLSSYIDKLNADYGTDYTVYDVGFSGIEAGKYKFTSTNKSHINGKINSSTGYPYNSIAMLGADFVHHELDSDAGYNDQGLADVAMRYDNNHQWRSTIRERLWWSGAYMDPTNATYATSQTTAGRAAYANNTNWPGVASFITERSVIGESRFYTNFNVGRGLRWYKDGQVSNDEEWSNISIQDIPITWQWWQDTDGTELTLDIDYGEGYGLGQGEVFDYSQIGGYNGGSSLVANGTLDAENFVHLYKTEIALNSGHTFELAYNKPSANDSSTVSLGMILQSDPSTVVQVPVVTSGSKTNGWVTVEADLGDYAGEVVAAFGLVLDPGADGSIDDWQVNFGSITITDGSASVPSAPTGLAIQEAFAGTGEMYLEWNLDHDYDEVKQYNVYVNDVFVGAKYDEVYYIKNLPATSGTISVVPVGADGREGEAATISFNLNDAGISNLTATSYDDGEFVVSWTPASGASGNVTVEVETRWHLMGEPVYETATVSVRSGSAIFTEMPKNGDYYTVRVYNGAADPISVTGSFVDVEIDPYEGEWVWTGNSLYLPMATTRDWRVMHIYENGVERAFQTTYWWDYRDGIIRGRSTKACLNFASTAEYVWIIMEDYAGNLSTPVYLRAPAVDEDMFPDAVLRQWVLDNVGDSGIDVMGYTGDLDLAGLEILDFTGLNNFTSATVLSVSGNQSVASIADIHAPASVTSLDISQTSIEMIFPADIEALPVLTKLTVADMDKLLILDISETGIEELATGAAENLENLFYVDLRGTPIDVSEGASAREFADWIDLNKTDRNKSHTIYNEGNISLDSQISGSFNNLGRIIDGNTGNYASASVGDWFTLDFGARYELDTIQLYFDGVNYSASAFTYETSNDNSNWDTLLNVTGNASATHTYTAPEGTEARYLKVTLNQRNGWSNIDIAEITVTGKFEFVYRSAVYYDGQSAPDPSDLIDLFNTVDAYDPADYTASSWAIVQEALDAVEETLGYTDPTITKREIKDCTELLRDALEELVLGGDAQALIDWAASLWAEYEEKADLYTVNSWNSLVDALQDAIDLAFEMDDELTLADYEAAVNAIDEAIDSLDRRAPDWLVEQLIELVDECNELVETHYTEESWEAFYPILAYANELLDDIDNAEWYDAYDTYIALAEAHNALKDISVDKSGLAMVIASAKEKIENEDKYIPVAIQNLKKVLAEAETVMADADATRDEVEDMALKLLGALLTVIEKADKTELEMLVTMAKTHREENYTPSTWAPFAAAIEDGEDLLADENAVDDEVQDAFDALYAALNELVRRADFYNLGLVIRMAENILDNAEDYAPASIAGLGDELLRAQAVYDNKDSTQDEVNAARDSLYAEVLKAYNKANKEALTAALKQGAGIKPGSYTPESFARFTMAMASAQAVLEDDNASQKEVDDAYKAVTDGIKGLKVPATQEDNKKPETDKGAQTPDTPAPETPETPNTGTDNANTGENNQNTAPAGATGTEEAAANNGTGTTRRSAVTSNTRTSRASGTSRNTVSVPSKADDEVETPADAVNEALVETDEEPDAAAAIVDADEDNAARLAAPVETAGSAMTVVIPWVVAGVAILAFAMMFVLYLRKNKKQED